MNRIRVPLAVDAQVRIPLGPALVSLRAVVMLALASPPAFVCLNVAALPVSYRLGLTVSIYLLAITLAVPEREGVWIALWAVYRAANGKLPRAIIDNTCSRAQVRLVANALAVSDARPPVSWPRHFAALTRITVVPSASTVAPGVVRLVPGGARGVLLLDGPAGSITSDAYADWCTRVIGWLLAVQCPAQFLSVLQHHDSHRARVAFDRRTGAWPRTPLLELERSVAATLAEQSLGFRHYVALCPGAAGKDGVPHLSSIARASRFIDTSDDEAAHSLHLALRLGCDAGLSVAAADRDDIADLMSQTVIGAGTAAIGADGVVQMGDRHQIVLACTDLPPIVHPAMVVESLMRSRAYGVVALHVTPVDPAIARKTLDRRLAMQRYTAREGNDGVDNQVALTDTMTTLASIARRDLQPCRIALTLAVHGQTRDEVAERAERVAGQLHGQGFRVTAVSAPGFLPTLATTPGGPPLGRTHRLTSDDVAACVLPALGTPFADDRHPLLGMSELTGAPVHLSVWSRPNHNAIIVGSSGAGKSVAAKTLLVRHVMEGACAVVIDPDSEFRRIMRAIGGTHLELGDDALNPLAASMGAPADAAAGLVLPVLSVMAGDERGMRDGRPVRRLPDEDQGWLYSEVAAFFRSCVERGRDREPVMHELVRFIETESAERALTPREHDRCRVITARLRRFTQGDRARVFDRASTFHVGEEPIAIGLRQIAMSYIADLTPALAVVLTAVLAVLGRDDRRLIVVVDEAHRVTGDPDAGEVLGQLVRQARKYHAGVWMCSQRVGDFVGTDLGQTLAATASTKFVFGAEETTLADVKDVFALGEEETAAISPPVTGRAVLISGAERTIVKIVPGPAVLAC